MSRPVEENPLLILPFRVHRDVLEKILQNGEREWLEKLVLETNLPPVAGYPKPPKT